MVIKIDYLIHIQISGGMGMSNRDKISSLMGWEYVSLSTRCLMITEKLSHTALILFALLYFQTTILIPCY